VASAPPAILAAIAIVSPVPCPWCGLAEVVYDDEFDRPEISHAYADCPNYADPCSPAAVEMARAVDDQIAAIAATGQYGEELPPHVWAAA
jgi:hypothetical protein